MLENIDKAILGKILEKKCISIKISNLWHDDHIFCDSKSNISLFCVIRKWLFLKLCEILKCFIELILSPKVYWLRCLKTEFLIFSVFLQFFLEYFRAKNLIPTIFLPENKSRPKKALIRLYTYSDKKPTNFSKKVNELLIF